MPGREDERYKTDYVRTLHPASLGCRARYRINPERGHIGAFVVQVEIEIDGHWLAMVRYDTAHGQPHRDRLDHTGAEIDKAWLPYDFTRAFKHATDDLRDNWQHYREEFLERMR